MTKKGKLLIVIITVLLIGTMCSAIGFFILNTCFQGKTDNTMYDENSIGEIYFLELDPTHIDENENGIKYVDNEILIVSNDNVAKKDVEVLVEKYNAEVVGRIEQTGDYQLRLKGVHTYDGLNKLVLQMNNEDIISRAEINYVFSVQSNQVDYDINCGNFSIIPTLMWGAHKINAPATWLFLNQHKDEINPVRLGIIDNCFYSNHEDLGFAEVFYNDSFETWYSDANEEEKIFLSHGTHVAGTMAAKGNNKEGICGVYPYGDGNLYGISTNGISYYSENTNLMIHKIALAELILRNVKVINYSMGYSIPITDDNGNTKRIDMAKWISEKMDGWKEKVEFIKNCASQIKDFLKRLRNLDYDFVICVAAGNSSSESSEPIESKYNSIFTAIEKYDPKTSDDIYDRIIVVGATNYMSNLCAFSNAGDRLDVCAPGASILSTFPYDNYGIKQGTSMSTPHVSGVAATMWSINNDLTGIDIKRIICETSLKSNNKVIDMFKAVTTAYNKGTVSIDNFTKPANGGIFCFIVDADNEKAICGASVEAIKDSGKIYSTQTDEFGHFELILPNGSYALKITVDGYEEYSKEVVVENYGINYLDEWIKMSRIVSPLVGCEWLIEPNCDYDNVVMLRDVYGNFNKEVYIRNNYDDYEIGETKYIKDLYISYKDNKFGLVDINGQELFGTSFERIYSDRGMLQLVTSDEFYTIDTEYNLIPYFSAHGREEYYAIYNNFDGKVYSYSDLDGRLYDKTSFDDTLIVKGVYYEGEINSETTIRDLSIPYDNHKYGLYVNKKLVVPTEYDEITCWDGRNDYSANSINSRNILNIDSQTPHSKDISVCIFIKNNKIFVYDIEGNCISKEVYNYMQNDDQEIIYSEGYLTVCRDGKWGLIDVKGNEVVKCQFEDISVVCDGKAWAKNNGKWGVIKINKR